MVDIGGRDKGFSALSSMPIDEGRVDPAWGEAASSIVRDAWRLAWREPRGSLETLGCRDGCVVEFLDMTF